MIKKIVAFIGILAITTACGTFALELDSKMTQSIFLQHKSQKKSIYLQKTNTTGVDDNIGTLVKEALLKKNYHFVDNPDKADYILKINTLNMNANRNQKEAAAAGMTGLSTGIVMMATKGAKDGLAGAVVGGVIGGVFAYAVADGQIRMQVDVSITEKLNENKIANYKTRIIAEAKQVHLTPQEGQPLLEKKISQQIAGIFL
jgi:hypothetical protein